MNRNHPLLTKEVIAMALECSVSYKDAADFIDVRYNVFYKMVQGYRLGYENLNLYKNLAEEQKLFEMRNIAKQIDEDRIPFVPGMEDFFGEKGNRFYKRELPQTTITFEQFINR